MLLIADKYNPEHCTVIHFITKNDINGNPRRLFGIFCYGEIVQIIDEDYFGSSALYKPWGDEIGKILIQKITLSVNISIKEFNKLKHL